MRNKKSKTPSPLPSEEGKRRHIVYAESVCTDEKQFVCVDQNGEHHFVYLGREVEQAAIRALERSGGHLFVPGGEAQELPVLMKNTG